MDVLDANDHDVGELLALIDELYESPPSPRERAGRGRKRPTAVVRRELLAQVEQLQRTLEALRSNSSSRDETELAQLWERVARRQYRQREIVVRENAQLKHTVQRQREIVWRTLAKALNEMMSLLPQATITHVPAQALPSSAAPPLLLRRLDAACDLLASRAVQVVSSYTREHDVQWHGAHSALRLSLRSSALYPFKLSDVATEVWRLVHDQGAGLQPLAKDDVYCANTTFQVSKPFGRVDVRGPSAMRRVFTQDGGVLVVWVSIQFGEEGDDTTENILSGLSMHETMWARVSRADASNPKSPVFVESVTESDVLTMSGSEVMTDRSDNGGPERLHKSHDFFERYAVEEGGRCQQKLENRLLDSCISRQLPN